jgi:anti-sigma regulatory factor (Ser/Thr protein kinase)
MCWSLDAGRVDKAASLRREIVGQLHRHGCPADDYGAAELILGELLSNASRYTPGEICVELDWTPSARVTVHDAGRGFAWLPKLPSDPHSESGRGLYIVSKLASNIEVDSDTNGCRVTATLPVRSRGSAYVPLGCVQGRTPACDGICPEPRRRISARNGINAERPRSRLKQSP